MTQKSHFVGQKTALESMTKATKIRHQKLIQKVVQKKGPIPGVRLFRSLEAP